MSEARNRKGLKRHDSIYVEVTNVSSSPTTNSNRSNLVHIAEIHDSKSKLLGSSGEENWAQHRGPVQQREHVNKKQPVQLRKKFRQPRKGSETDTLSEVDSGEASGGETPRKSLRHQDTQDTSDRSSQSKTLVVPSVRHIKRVSAVDNTSSLDTSSKDSQDYTALNVRKTRHREPRRGSLTDTLSEATDSESTVARRPVAPPRPSLDTTGDSQELHSQESIDQPRPPLRVKKLRRKRRGGEAEDGRETDEASVSDRHSRISHLNQDADHPNSGDERVVVRVEACDSLRFLDFCRCPTIRLHIVDPVTGDYKMSSCDENTPIPPLQTQPFNMKIHRSVKPVWEEDLVIREPSSLVVSKQSLLLFELFDFVKGNTVAWAFLKLIASNGASNLDRPLRLQLFKPSKNGKQPSSSGPKCYGWWSKGKYSQYKSTLYVSVTCSSSTTDEQANASAKSLQKQQNETQSQDNQGVEESRPGVEEEEVLWTRYPGQSCKFPNSLLVERECGKDGALCLAFSHNGKLLAVPTSAGIHLFSIPSTKLFLSLDKQQGLIYDLAWSEDDDYLVSVSADSTACLWNIKKKTTRAVKVLAHPTYVYCCCWISSDLFASGCSDGVVRVWSVNSNSAANTQNKSKKNGRKDSSTPIEFLAKHSTRVNSLASSERSLTTQRTESTESNLVVPVDYILVSADSSGVIIIWRFDSVSKKFEMEQEVKLKELRGQVINRVVLVGRKGDTSRLLVQSKDSLIRLIDISNGATLQVYQGGYIVKSKTGGCSVCGCSRRIWAPSEDASLVSWDYATGEKVATYTIVRPSPHASLALALHPLDHILAYTFHSPSSHPTIKILHYDREGDGNSVGLVILEPSRRTALRWSALDSPLYEVPPVKVKPPPGLKPPQSPATPSSRLSPAPTPLPRTTRRFSGEGPRLALESVASALINLPVKGTPKPGDSKKSETGSSLSKIPVKISRNTEANKQTKQNTGTSRDSRLSNIIGKMDLILIQASPKQMTTVK